MGLMCDWEIIHVAQLNMSVPADVCVNAVPVRSLQLDMSTTVSEAAQVGTFRGLSGPPVQVAPEGPIPGFRGLNF